MKNYVVYLKWLSEDDPQRANVETGSAFAHVFLYVKISLLHFVSA